MNCPGTVPASKQQQNPMLVVNMTARFAVGLDSGQAGTALIVMMRYGKRASGMVRHTMHIVPNIVRIIVPPLHGRDGVGGWPEITFHTTLVDDENHMWVITTKVQVTGQEAERYLQKRIKFLKARAEAPPVMSLVNDIWSGKVHFPDARHPELAIVQDIAMQTGQGRIEDRENEFLGRSDAGIVTWRRILTRQLQAIATGNHQKMEATQQE